MEHKNNLNNSIKITLLEIKPSLKELERNNNELSVIFQGINVFYSLRKLLLNNTDILINNCKNSLIISLVKSDNIFASALLNIKLGESWVTFNYETKNKSTLKPNLNSMDCIKIKISCKQNINNNSKVFSNNNANNNNNLNKININNNISKIKRYHTNINLLTRKKPNKNDNKSPLKYYSLLSNNSNKNSYNHRYSNSIDSTKLTSITTFNKNNSKNIKYSDFPKMIKNDVHNSQSYNLKNGEFSLITFNYSKINTSSSNIFKNKNNFSNINSIKISNKINPGIKNQMNYKNYEINACLDKIPSPNKNLWTETKKEYISKFNNIKKRLTFSQNSFNITNHSPQQNIGNMYINSLNSMELNNHLFLGYNKINKNTNNTLNVNKNNKTLKNSLLVKKNIQGNVTNSYSTATTKKNEGSLNSFQEDEEKNNIKNINRKNKYPLTSKRQKTNMINNKSHSNIKNNKSQSHLFFNNNNNNIYKNKKIFKNLNNSEKTKNLDKINNEEIYQNYLKEIGDDDSDLDEYFKFKNDFDLLYNGDYINNIQNDLLKLEIELFFEKMIELISLYHKEVEIKTYENKIERNNYKEKN